MSTMNIWILVVLLLGFLCLVLSARMDRRSSFEDGTFIYQMILLVAGACAVAGSLALKFVTLMFM